MEKNWVVTEFESCYVGEEQINSPRLVAVFGPFTEPEAKKFAEKDSWAFRPMQLKPLPA